MVEERSISRRGFILLTVLIAMVSAVGLAARLTLLARDAVSTARNRSALIRAQWLAEGCTATVLAAINDRLAAETGERVEELWRVLDRQLVADAAGERCETTVRSDGERANINGLSGEALSRALSAVGVDSARTGELVAALFDWIDADDSVQSGESERAWYRLRGLPLPRNGPLRSIEELALVRGFREISGLDRHFCVCGGPLVPDRASLVALSTLPAVSRGALEAISALRQRGQTLSRTQLLTIVQQYGSGDSGTAWHELLQRTADAPSRWIISVVARSDDSPITVRNVVWIARAERRAAIVDRELWY